MKRSHRTLFSTALVLLCLALMIGVGVLLLKTLPKKQPAAVGTIQTGAVFEQNTATAAPDREQAYEGELPNLSDTVEPDEAETPAPEDEAASAAQKLAEQTLAGMTLEEKLWQLFFVTPEAITNVDTATLAGDTTRAALEQQPVGGLVYFAKNLENREQTVAMLENTQSYAKIPLFLGVDEEGGTVSRLKTSGLAIDTGVGSMQSVGETADPAAAYAAGQEIAGHLHALGFNLDFAPVADVSSGKDAVIGSRSFGTDPELCASMAGIVSNALTDGGIIPCLKHFPGYGSAASDDHEGAVSIGKTLEELESSDLLPYRRILASQDVPFIMVTHLRYPALTGGDTPADLSSEIVTDLLRNKLGYENVIITDSHQMASITDHYSAAEAAVAAITAGCDMVLMPEDLQEAYDGLKNAVADGTLTEARIDESVLRILTVKAEYNLLTE